MIPKICFQFSSEPQLQFYENQPKNFLRNPADG